MPQNVPWGRRFLPGRVGIMANPFHQKRGWPTIGLDLMIIWEMSVNSFAVTRGAEKKIVITTSNFTPQAREEANHAEVELINGEELATLIATHLPDWPARQ